MVIVGNHGGGGGGVDLEPPRLADRPDPLEAIVVQPREVKLGPASDQGVRGPVGSERQGANRELG
jgi:hypothetical protein